MVKWRNHPVGVRGVHVVCKFGRPMLWIDDTIRVPFFSDSPPPYKNACSTMTIVHIRACIKRRKRTFRHSSKSKTNYFQRRDIWLFSTTGNYCPRSTKYICWWNLWRTVSGQLTPPQGGHYPKISNRHNSGQEVDIDKRSTAFFTVRRPLADAASGRHKWVISKKCHAPKILKPNFLEILSSDFPKFFTNVEGHALCWLSR